ncbi:MAG: DNA polymerase IV, partial [Eggerthellaceae bacterium]|nr:DNA polymerase IV [Eggerthellaceae bacterium]
SDLTDRASIEAAIATVSTKVGRRLRKNERTCSGVVLKMRYADRSVRSTTAKLSVPTDNEYDFLPLLDALIDELWEPGVSVRLDGVAAIHLDGDASDQLSLFPADHGDGSVIDPAWSEGLIHASDAIRDRFGEDAIRFGHEIRTRYNTTGSSSKNPADYRR